MEKLKTYSDMIALDQKCQFSNVLRRQWKKMYGTDPLVSAWRRHVFVQIACWIVFFSIFASAVWVAGETVKQTVNSVWEDAAIVILGLFFGIGLGMLGARSMEIFLLWKTEEPHEFITAYNTLHEFVVPDPDENDLPCDWKLGEWQVKVDEKLKSLKNDVAFLVDMHIVCQQFDLGDQNVNFYVGTAERTTYSYPRPGIDEKPAPVIATGIA